MSSGCNPSTADTYSRENLDVFRFNLTITELAVLDHIQDRPPATPLALKTDETLATLCGEFSLSDGGRVLVQPGGGPDTLRIRVVPQDSGGFRDDLPSALPSNGSSSSNSSSSSSSSSNIFCATKLSSGQPFRSGNVRVMARGDQTLLVERVSDGQQLFHTTSPIAWTPASISGVRVNIASLELGSPPDPVFGLGQHHDPTLREYNLLPDNGETTIPLMHWPLAGATLLINVPSAGKLFTKPGSVSWQSEACLQLDLWIATTSGTPPSAATSIAAAGSWPELLRKYVRATGHPAALPAWTTGFIQSKDRYDSQQVVENVSAGFASRQLPLSMLVIDWQSWAPAPRGDERFGSSFPDPKSMVAALASKQVQLMVSPYLPPG